MRIFAECGYQAADLAILNWWCTHLHAIFLSDICNASGMGIELHRWTSNVPADHHPYHWPTMSTPSPGEWAHWQWCLQQCLNLGRQQQLPLLLRKWKHQMYHRSGWFTETTREQLFWPEKNRWFSITLIPRCWLMCTFHCTPKAIKSDEVPIVQKRASIYYHRAMVTPTRQGPIKSTFSSLHTSQYSQYWDTRQCKYSVKGNAIELSRQSSKAVQSWLAMAPIN